MGQLVPLPSQEGLAKAAKPRSLEAVDDLVCNLCGEPLTANRQRFRMVSPLATAGSIVVCSTCRRAALGEGYRPDA